MSDEGQNMPVQELNLKQLFDRALAGWKTPIAFSVLAVIITIILLSRSGPIYEVRMSVVPAPSSQTEMGSSNPGGGGLGALLGVMGGQTNSAYTRYQNLLTSTAVAERMQRKHDMLHVVYANYWDAKQRKWVPPQTLRGVLLGWLFSLSGVPLWTPPDITDLASYLESTLVIIAPVQSDIVTISVRDPDPAFATRLMLMAHQEANEVLRDQVAIRATQQVAYLQQKLSQTTVQDYRATLLALLSTQEKTLMLTQTSAPYAAEILSPPVAPLTPVAPRPVFSMALAILVGALVGVSVAVLFGPDWFQRLRGALLALRRRRQPGAF